MTEAVLKPGSNESILIGDFSVTRSAHGCFVARDTCKFNNWGERNDIWNKETAALWAQWATAFKRGKTFETFERWRINPARSLAQDSAREHYHSI